jgi:hypothetical protein
MSQLNALPFSAVSVAFLAVSIVATVMQSLSMVRILRYRQIDGARRGLARTAAFRVGASTLYVLLGATVLFVSAYTAGILALACFTLTQITWIGNGIADARLANPHPSRSRHSATGNLGRGSMSDEDPLRGSPIDPAVEPPGVVTPDLTGVARSRHVMGERLVDPDGEPARTDRRVDLTLVPEHVVRRIDTVDARHRFSAALLWAGVAVAIALTLLIAWLVNRRLDDLEARNLRNDTESAQTQAEQHVAQCREATFLSGIPETTIRANWPAGPTAFDVQLAAVRRSAHDAQCPGF